MEVALDFPAPDLQPADGQSGKTRKGAGKSRSRNDRRFPPRGGQGRGVVWVSTLQTGGGSRRWRTLWTTTTLHSQRASPRCCGRGLAWKALLEAGWHGFPASVAIKRIAAAPRVPPLAQRGGAAYGRDEGGESDPFFGAGAPPEGVKWATPWATRYPPGAGRSLSPQRSLRGRASSRPTSRQRRTHDGK